MASQGKFIFFMGLIWKNRGREAEDRERQLQIL